MGQAQVRLYTFFQHSFAESILSPFFDLEAPFDGIPLYMAHLVFASPPPCPLASMETNPSEVSSSFWASTPSVSKHPSDNPGAADIMENGFYIPKLG